MEEGSVEYAVADEGAELLEGVETDWLLLPNGRPRVKVIRPGWEKGKGPLSWGQKLTGLAYAQAWTTWAQTPKPKVKTVIVDTITTMAEVYRIDPCHGKDPRRGYSFGQSLCVSLYYALWNVNPHLNIILLHHLAEVTVEAKNDKGQTEFIKDTYTLATCGKALQQEWPKRFTGVFQLECRPTNKAERSGAIGMTHQYFVRLKPHKDFKGLKIRSGITKHPSELNITCEPGNYDRMLEGWDTIFELVDTARSARAAYINAVS